MMDKLHKKAVLRNFACDSGSLVSKQLSLIDDGRMHAAAFLRRMSLLHPCSRKCRTRRVLMFPKPHLLLTQQVARFSIESEPRANVHAETRTTTTTHVLYRRHATNALTQGRTQAVVRLSRGGGTYGSCSSITRD
mmetsp:Transcript_10668/g.22632  ORF Transcript_10668/g.22632 Transcript_10668/m.22632 type:complete len:135 (+) Transcript_10668:583-987(+)